MTTEWTKHHTDLQNLMKKEIDTMRQLLGNLHQEEMLIIQKEMSYLNQLMEERGHLIEQLSYLREDRIVTTGILETINHSHPDVPLEQLIPPDNENSCELLALRDQMLALLDRMNLQCSRNEMLTHLANHQAAFQPLPAKKTKISIATLPPEDYNDRNAS
ncbi:MAG TPA: flagellar export chaperone FlgN [Rhabdochlamydiaceae bacterium]|nr:flagellar export chaperone FlgN [Rhabdochlamydiaceae bacterium]